MEKEIVLMEYKIEIPGIDNADATERLLEFTRAMMVETFSKIIERGDTFTFSFKEVIEE